MAEQLTLLSLGVDLDAMARRIGAAQERANLSDEACATVAGVKVETWRSWKDGGDRPGVARLPKLAEAVRAPVSWLMYDVDTAGTIERSESEQALNFSRRAAALVAEAVPLIEGLNRIATEVERDGVPIPGGMELGEQLRTVANSFDSNSAIPSWRIDENVVLRSRANVERARTNAGAAT